MPRVFISYTRKDGRTFAERLCADLESCDPWLDRAELAGGADWVHEIERAIDESDFFLPVFTRAYHDAPFAPLELSRAIEKRKRLIPLRFHPDADFGLLLARTQYIDFSDPATHADGMRALLECLDAVFAEPTVVPAGGTQWEAVRARAERLTRRVVTPALYDPRLYVRRTAAEEELARFLGGGEQALLLIGDSGVGKSSLLGHAALELLAEGHAVLMYDCSTLADAEIEDEIARDLGVSGPAFDQLDRDAAQARKRLVLIFDSINDYRGSERNGVQILIRRLHALVNRLPGRDIRVLVSCNTAVWDRLQRSAPIRFDRERFHHCGDDPYLRLTQFTDEERDAAYTRYREVFGLRSALEELPPAVRARLREPVLLRMTAEAYRGQPLLAVNLGVGIYRRYFEERVSLPREIALVDEIAGEMLAQRTGALSMIDLARHERLGPEILNEDPGSPYSQLLDRGVLQEVRGDLRAGIVVKFAHTRVAAYALAANLLRRTRNVDETVADLVQDSSRFPLGWEAARTLLLLGGDDAAFLALAASAHAEQRALASEALVELHAQDAKAAFALLEKLLDQPSESARRAALKTAYNIGPEARDFFRRAAIDGDPSMRESVKNTLYLIWRNESQAGRQSVTEALYLIWRHAPGFTYDFLESLLAEMRLRSPAKFFSILPLLLDLSLTIYNNHCDEQEVLERTSHVIHELAVNKLHLPAFKTGILGAPVEKLIFRTVARVFGGQILDWMLSADEAPVQEFFRVPAERRALLARIADFYDPATRLGDAHDDLLPMLREELPIFSGAASMAIAVHAIHDFPATEPLVRRLWDEVGAKERRWLLIGFKVLLKETPAEWVALLEDLTKRYLDDLVPSAKALDLVLVPLGLAYGKRGGSMPLFEQVLRDALAENDASLAAGLIAALNGVGFYYPAALFDVLRPAFARLENEEVAGALVTTLATVRTLHFDAVDQFLHGIEAPDAFRHRIDAAADVALVHRFIRILGYFNSGVHLTLHYPRMRRCLSAGSLRLLAVAQNPAQFIADYTLSALHMLRDAKFQMLEWTLPE